jgi:hypothetical protein
MRSKRGLRQRIVAYLGELAASELSGWAQLGRSLSGKQRPQPSLFDPPHYDEAANDEPVLVNLNGIRLERLRDFGDVWMALGLWRLLGLHSLLQSLAGSGREEVPWSVVAAILTIARFCKPSSELHIETTWYGGTLRLSEEHDASVWAPLANLLQWKLTDGSREFAEAYVKRPAQGKLSP